MKFRFTDLVQSIKATGRGYTRVKPLWTHLPRQTLIAADHVSAQPVGLRPIAFITRELPQILSSGMVQSC